MAICRKFILETGAWSLMGPWGAGRPGPGALVVPYGERGGWAQRSGGAMVVFCRGRKAWVRGPNGTLINFWITPPPNSLEHCGRILISNFQQLSASIEKILSLEGRLGTRL